MDSRLEEDQQFLQELDSLLHPPYPPGCDTPTFLSQFAPLTEAINRYDLSLVEMQESDSLIDKSIKLFNDCLTECPRIQFITMLMDVIRKCRGALKGLAIGRSAIKCSMWMDKVKIQSPVLKMYHIQDPNLRRATDELYLKYRKIPRLEFIMIDFEGLLVAKQNFESIFIGQERHLPACHHHYIAIIASATLGSKYIWNRAVYHFLSCGGDISWIQKGIYAAPPLLRKISNLSGKLAYSMRQFLLSNCFKDESGTDREYLFEGLLVLAYYQCLSCLSLTTGLISQSSINQNYLPKSNVCQTSQKSFQTFRKCENMEAESQLQAAEEMNNILDSSDEEEEISIINQIQKSDSLADRKAHSFRRIKIIESSKQFQDEELREQLQGLRCIDQLKRTFSKLVDFQYLAQIYKTLEPVNQNELVLASEWGWELNSLKQVQLLLGSQARGALGNLVNKLKVIGGEAGQKINQYYKFSNNYIHQFICYRRLLQELSPIQRAYLKLITKTPFLFTEGAYSHMQKQLQQRKISSLNFVLQAIGCKLELAVTMITLLSDRAEQE